MWENIKDKLIWVGLTLAGLASAFFIGQRSSDKEYKKQKIELKNLIKKQEKEINRLENRKGQLQKEIDRKLEEVKLKSMEVKELKKKNKVSQEEIKKAEKEYSQLQKEYTDIEKKEKETEKTIKTIRENNDKLLERSEEHEKVSSLADIDNAMQSDSDSKQ